MTLQKIEHNTLFQRIKIGILGKEKPNILTRFSVITAFLIWLYFATIYGLTLISLLLVDTLKNEKFIKASLEDVGLKKYGYMNTVQKLTNYATVELAILILALMGLIFIWRKKRVGFLFYIAANIGLILVVYLMMGYTYLSTEFGSFNLILIGASTLYFTAGFFLFYRKKKVKN
jgi:hypothetical protein